MHMILNKVINHHIGPNAVPILDIHYDNNHEFNQHKNTKLRWELIVKCNYRSTYWAAMEDINIFTLWDWLSISLVPISNINYNFYVG